MANEIIYAKTQKGFEEMTRRTYRLPARMRALLIMIDGKQPAGELFARSNSPEESQQLLETLLRDGFVEPTGGMPNTARAADQPSHQPAASELALTAAKRYIVQALLDALGPEADHFTLQIESARNAAELHAAAIKFLEVIRSASDHRKAEAFRDGLVQLRIIGLADGLPVTRTAGPATTALDDAKRVMIEWLRKSLGPDADPFTLATERAASTEELRALVGKYQEVVRSSAGKRKAEEFVASISAALGR
jgi:hypothetical protein